jgi:hypothetical protein
LEKVDHKLHTGMEQHHHDDWRMDSKIVNNDVRIRNHVVQTYEGGTLRRFVGSSGPG